jgi:hypothetical protein
MRKTLSVLIFSSLLSGSVALCSPVQSSATFTGGIFGDFSVAFNNGPAGLKLQSVTFDLGMPLFVDPTFVPPGALLPLPFTPLSGSAVTGFSGTTGIVDGSTSFTLSFNDFSAGEAFSFALDVDGPCGNIFCQLPASLTGGGEFAASTVTAVFAGPGFNTTSLQGTYTATGAHTAAANITGQVSETPEPASIGLLGAGLLGIALRVRMRRQTS